MKETEEDSDIDSTNECGEEPAPPAPAVEIQEPKSSDGKVATKTTNGDEPGKPAPQESAPATSQPAKPESWPVSAEDRPLL